MRPEWFSAVDAQSLEVSEKTNAILPPIPYDCMFIGCHSSLPIVLSSGAPTLTPTHLVNTRCLNGGLASLQRSRKCNQCII